MLRLLAAGLLCYCGLASAAVINIEFNFTPYTGNPASADHVQTVPGRAAVFLNNVPLLEEEIGKRDTPVMFEAREIGAALWLTGKSMGPALRKGKNKIRIEFSPANPAAAYDAQLRWASVTDQETRTEPGPGRVTSTNQSNEGSENKKATGKLVFEREFAADFAVHRPWHDYPPVATLGEADKQAIAALVVARAQTFKPDFAPAHQLLQTAATPGIELNLEQIKKTKVLDKGYAAGIRITPTPLDKLDFVVTGNPEVVVRGKSGPIFILDPKLLTRVKGEELQMGLAIVLSTLYPPQLLLIRDPAGKWAVAQ
jgi:hypothetical protein